MRKVLFILIVVSCWVGMTGCSDDGNKGRMQRYSIQEVSEMVGFNDTATFRKRFTEQYGVTPSQYLPGKN